MSSPTDPPAAISIPVPQFLADAIVSFIPEAYRDWWVDLYLNHPLHLFIETTLILVIIYIVFKSPSKKQSAKREVDDQALKERLALFQPEPLAPAVLPEISKLVLDDLIVVDSAANRAHVMCQGKECLNFASSDFLDFGSSKEIANATRDALAKYGVGSCGPRGFYGTIDAHVYLEEAIAKYFNMADAIIYSDAASAVSSAIPAFANRNDLLLVDELCNESIMVGVRLSRARAVYYKHNDLLDLEDKMKQIQAEDERLGRKPASQRRFVVFEGLFRNTGDVPRLDLIHDLKMKYKWRLFADECLSFGVLGKTGRGISELYQVPADCIEILIGSLETTLASVGGFCVGTQEVVEHQRLNGAGYCFSASAPPFTACAAMATLDLLSKAGSKELPQLAKLAELFQQEFAEDEMLQVVTSYKSSPVVHLRLLHDGKLDHVAEAKALRHIAKQVLANDSVLVVPTHLEQGSTLRLYIHATHTEQELKLAAKALIREARAGRYF